MKSPFGKVQVGEARSSSVEKKEAGSHQVEIEARSQKRKRLEENSEDSPSKKKFGNGVVNVKIFEPKSDKSCAGVGGGNVKNLLEKFGNLAKQTLHEKGGDREVNKILEKAKAIPGCAEQREKLCGKPMAESLQIKICAEPTKNTLRGDPKK